MADDRCARLVQGLGKCADQAYIHKEREGKYNGCLKRRRKMKASRDEGWQLMGGGVTALVET
jgi:hypothetical protein